MSGIVRKIPLPGAMIGAMELIVHFCVESGASAKTPSPEGWIHELTGFVLMQKGIEQDESFEACLGRLWPVRHRLRDKGLHGTYVALTRFMNILETRGGSGVLLC